MKRVLVIGNGMVSYKFCQKLSDQAKAQKYGITVIGEEPYVAYNRVNLSKYFEDQSEDDLTLAPFDWYNQQGIKMQISELATQIDSAAKKVITHKGNEYEYDILVLATGSVPFVPTIKGADKKGVFVYRTIEDLKQIIKYRSTLPQNARSAILGGGLLGLEAGKATLDMNLKTDVIEFASRLMPRQLDDRASETMSKLIGDMGIQVHLNKNTQEIIGEDTIEELQFSDGTKLPCDLLIISAGIRPRDELAEKAGILKGPRGGYLVDEWMQTNIDSIYAIGEVASYQGMCYGLVAPGYEMAQVAVDHILGGNTTMSSSVDMSTKLKLIGVDVASFGDALDDANLCESIIVEDRFNGVYKRINVDKETNTLKGGILVGDIAEYTSFHQKYMSQEKLGDNPGELLIGGAGEAQGVEEMTDSTTICTCESINKGQLYSAVKDNGCHTLKALCSSTGAGTGCGGCKPLVADILEYSLSQLGIDNKRILCEHFNYTRQELYDIVHIKQIKTYEELLDAVGTGDGCETCRPAAASIFASLYAETAVVQEDIQDTNDRFLANIQRNGSYSVVPRVPGGEITPDKLIVIGEVAKKYNLYTKITGGQRIDLFGAKINDLPSIWKELIDAGFESGHAYGKALRTVKSCVGSTWCRYGLDESVSFAIALENRYKGIRSPHKLKGGVSGCIRECAEARCKDFGVIAVEGGWNLYVCGNGGANPKHAKLLAEKIDKQTCIKLVDRFLMYYIKTAAPLQRTAAWLDKLNGGIDYLRKVVVDDALGIADTLEAEMKTLVGNYKCEWKEVVESPELQRRFSHFINTDEDDDQMVFVPMRDQKMPKPWK